MEVADGIPGEVDLMASPEAAFDTSFRGLWLRPSGFTPGVDSNAFKINRGRDRKDDRARAVFDLSRDLYTGSERTCLGAPCEGPRYRELECSIV